MSTGFFGDVTRIKYEGPESTNPLAFRHYDADEMVMGKRMEDHLRFAVAYWHSFAWEGGDPFGGRTFDRPWYPQDSMELAKLKADVAFEMFSALGALSTASMMPMCVRKVPTLPRIRRTSKRSSTISPASRKPPA
jgi:xylose isomerase